MVNISRTGPSPGLIGRALLGLLAALLLVSAAAAGQASPNADPELRQPPWQPLGPLGPRRVDALAVSPGWPTEKLLVGARNSGQEHGADLVRSRDGGRSWAACRSLSPGLRRPCFAPWMRAPRGSRCCSLRTRRSTTRCCRQASDGTA